jgi:hypothetical protein
LKEAKKYRRLFLRDLFFITVLMFALTNQFLAQKFVLGIGGPILFGILYFLRVLLLLLAVFHSLKWMNFLLVKNSSKVKRPKSKLVLFSFLIFGLLAETVFMFIPQSQGNTQFGVGTHVWTIFYARDINEKSYRDENLAGRINNGKKRVFFLGDSFTYGNGINNPENRFTNIIAKEISPKGYEIFNLGKGNSDTRDEFLRLMQFQYKPDVLVLQYYFNDIDPTAHRFEKAEPKKTGPTEIFFMTAVGISQTSFFLNFIAVNLAKFTTPFQSGDFKKKMAGAYHDKKILAGHLNDMQAIINYCSLNKTKLYVLLIPDMREPGFTERDCYPAITSYLNEKGIDCISIYNEIKDKTTPERVVSQVDAHANEDIQKIIAAKLKESIPEFNE